MKSGPLEPRKPLVTLPDGTILVGRNAICDAKDLKQRLSWEVYSVQCGGPGPVLPGADVTLIDNRANLRTPRDCYQEALDLCDKDILVLMHDDVTVYEHAWADRVMEIFEKHPDCVAVGLGGAMGLGSDDLYKKPYQINQLARRGYVSNATDWQVHGGHETGVRQVAVLDAYFMAVRTKWMRRVGGWPTWLTHHCVDTWLACKAAREGKSIYVVGCSVMHWGGGSSTKDPYKALCKKLGRTLETDHQIPHYEIYSRFGDVLPIRVPEPVTPDPIFKERR